MPNKTKPPLSTPGTPSPPYQGVVLAAGRGSRLRPLTDRRPKPLLPFGGIPLLYLAQWHLQQVGIKRIIVNAHYRWDDIVAALGQNPLQLEVALSLEQPHILGTGGAFARINKLRGHAPLVVVNGDIVSDFPVQALLSHHEELQAVATMALLPQPHPGESVVWAAAGRIVAFGGDSPPCPGATAHGFACLQVLSDRFLGQISEEREESIITYYKAALKRGETVGAYIAAAFWYDLGTPQAYLAAHHHLLQRWQEQPFHQHNDPFGLLALAAARGNPLHFVAAGEATAGGIIGPSLVGQGLQAPTGSRLGPFLCVEAGVHLPAHEAVHASHGVILAGSSLLGHTTQTYHHMIVDHDTLIKLAEESDHA